MVYENDDGLYIVNASVPKELADQIEEAIENDPEVTQSRLVREGLRLWFEKHD